MSHEIHSPGDEAAAPGGPLSNTLSLPRGCPLDCPRGRSPSATDHGPRRSPAPAAEVPGGPLSSPPGPASWSSGRWSAWRTPGPHPGCGRPGTAGRRDRAVTETSGPVAVRGVCSLTTGPSCPRAPRGAPPGRWTRPGLSPGLPHVQVSLEGPATRRPREALWALSVLAPPATPPGCALGGGAGLGSLETWGWRGRDWKGCWKLGAQEGSRQSSRHPPTLKGGGEGLLGPGCSRNRPMRPGRPQLFMRDGTRGGSGDREVPDILPWFPHSSPGPVGHRWAGHSGPA